MSRFSDNVSVFALVGVLLTTACSDIGQPMPANELVAVLVDLHVLEARQELLADTHPALRDSVLAAHGISDSKFRAAIEYYTDRPDEYVSLYNQVIDSLAAEEADLEERGVIELLPPP